MVKIKVFSSQLSSRLIYIFDYVFNNRLGIGYEFISDPEKFTASEGPKINYSNWFIQGSFQIFPHEFIFEQMITDFVPEVGHKNEQILLFPNNRGHLPFDIFSACFFMLSRYEEYQPFNPDAHGRFSASQSLACQNNFLDQPVVDQWINYLKKELLHYYKDLTFKPETFKVIPTIDIDSPWCYKHKGWKRNLGGLARDFIKLNWREIPERISVLSGLKTDSHFVFNWLNTVCSKAGRSPYYFIHVGGYGTYDKTIDRNHSAFLNFISGLGATSLVGLHPSYEAAQNPLILKEELTFLSVRLNVKITSSRQHYLKFTLPEYYEVLSDFGITDDYSMGYADQIGFRAGTSRSFPFYNLKSEQTTSLTIHPFCIMDRTLCSYQNSSIQTALVTINRFVEELKNVNGNFVFLWHNESLSNRMEWKGWRNLFLTMLEQA